MGGVSAVTGTTLWIQYGAQQWRGVGTADAGVRTGWHSQRSSEPAMEAVSELAPSSAPRSVSDDGSGCTSYVTMSLR